MPDSSPISQPTLLKAPSGISGFDEITGGGLPKGRPTLVCGGAGCGKTLFGMEFLVRGIGLYDEPGVFVSFEETSEELTQNFASMGFGLTELIQQKKLIIDYVSIDSADSSQAGDYSLDGLFVRLNYAIQKIGAKRVVLDTLEVLFGILGDSNTLRTELRRLFRWLKDQGVTAVITSERGEITLTRHGIEEYISDCVLVLDHRVEDQMSTRRLRIVKYRGSQHGTDEYPFLIDTNGFSVLPVTSVRLDYAVSEERVSSGIPDLDQMMEGRGFFRASTILVSGSTGTGKTSIAAQYVDAACRRGERCIYFSFEESPQQLMRNLASIGLKMKTWVDSGMLRFKTFRPTMYNLEMHLSTLHTEIEDFNPLHVIVDPVSNFKVIGSAYESRILLTRLIDFLKVQGITALLTSLTAAGESVEQSEINISSLIDTWLLVRNLELNGERNRVLYILKSRGMLHSNQVREFIISDQGIRLMDVYLGKSGVLTGSARLAQEARERDEELAHQQSLELKQLQLERKRIAVNAQIAALQAELDVEDAEHRLLLDQETRRKVATLQYTHIMADKRGSSNSKSSGIDVTDGTEEKAGRDAY